MLSYNNIRNGMQYAKKILKENPLLFMHEMQDVACSEMEEDSTSPELSKTSLSNFGFSLWFLTKKSGLKFKSLSSKFCWLSNFRPPSRMRHPYLYRSRGDSNLATIFKFGKIRQL